MSSNTINWKSIFSLSSIIYTILGVISALIALQGFMIPNHFLDGGVTGVSILIEEVFNIPFSISLILFNLPFIYLGYRKIGKTFSIKAFIAVILLAVLMTFITFPQVTSDKVLIAVFGGFFIGLGIGLVIRGGGVIDGLEIIAHYTNKRVAFSTSEIIMSVNTLLFIGAAFEFGIETAMYSILVYYTAMKTSDYVVDGFEEFTALTIISREYEEVKSIIVNDFGKAITVYKGERGYLPGSFEVKQDCDIVMTIVTRIEIHRIKEKIKETDPNAFFYVQRIKEVKGGLGKHNELQH
ncbi:YitT family protein [Salegentibacter sp. JZCK2]|uniref:YitT family protein n=1 Tax=Salegentibacter tibetensis TaxID=2873600 RepID=UPI001CCD499E|nr:YitT family protein [Salegentibacter tibetensis]MBZ9730638.1 YitT family protein [Salegentibacter tibetensis]